MTKESKHVENNDERKEKKLRPMRNLFIISFAFLLNFSAFRSLEVIQSSLNSEIGTLSLSATYASLVVSALFLPPLIIDILGYRKSMAVSTLTYVAYIAANFYPRAYTLIPAGILLGAGAAVLWSAQRVYLTRLAFFTNGDGAKKSEKKIGSYFGIFYSLYSMSGIGSIIMSILLSIKSPDSIDYLAADISNSTTEISTTVIYHDDMSDRNQTNCGIPASANWKAEPDRSGNKSGNGVDTTMLYILLSVYLCFSFASMLLILFGADEIPVATSRAAKIPIGESSDSDSIDDQLMTSNDEDLTMNERSNQLELNEKPTIVHRASKRTMILATGHLMATNRQMQLIIPSTVHFGILYTLITIHFMKFWVTCSLGIAYVGYATLVYGIASSISGFAVGKLLCYFRRVTIFCFICLIETGSLIAIMLWTPTKESTDHYAFFLLTATLSVAYTSHKCVNNTMYSAFFTEEKEAAQSSFAFWDSFGRAVMFGVAAKINVQVQVYIIVGFMVIGGIMYFIAEWRHSKTLTEKSSLSRQFEETIT